MNRFAPRDQLHFVPSAEKLHRSPLQEPDEILIPGMDEPAPKHAAPVKMGIDDGTGDEDFG
jgi:hypothetical protein